ncbi:DEAD/DEAH box helicase family protein [Flavonifractor plautii]|jgi:helicase C-terminal domain protein|uniref:DEAD/DEAH box helicase family protein n=3 Tax=Flavonifractor plautii TaxID=292800 RepID=UPI001D022EE2|nr:DEAD/DEAH box helicase family protein [Flavonifractor plautii]MCB5583901.1 DEAD/DEAH box helicase family protein [Flavonifractor plautii]
MDRLTRTANIIKSYYSYKKNSDAATFVKEVCGFFDFIKNEPISEADMNFLIFLANEAGIPQYFDLFKDKFTDCRISDENIKTLTISALFHDASLIRGNSKLHRYQKNVLDSFKIGQQNRFVLTAPTSFGKTFLVYEIIQKMQYQNVLLIFPAISLLSENYARLCKLDIFQSYKIHSLSEEEFSLSERNIFIFTPERFLSFMDSHQHIHFDFAFIDEVYKIDNSFIIDPETSGENERDTAYRLALEFICNLTSDMLLAGPYMALPQSDTQQHKSFNNFAEDNGFCFLRYNQFEIVSKEYITVKGKRQYHIDEIPVEIGSISKGQKIANIIKVLSTPKENTIIYCGRRADTEMYARTLLKDQMLISSFQETCSVIESSTYEIFLNHLEHTFGNDWIVLKALRGRIGIHHSLIPKYIQKEIINLFNEGSLLCLFSTTTITEGVNTSAKNIIITSNKKGIKPLRQFDAKNIAGRAGRFYQHYSGRVIDLNNNFEEIVNGQPEILEHKNYDITFPKTDVDYQITKDKYLSEVERQDKEDIQAQIIASEIPSDVFDCFRVVGPKDKLTLYSYISSVPWWTIEDIKRVSITLAGSNAHRLYWPGFQAIMDIILPVVREEKLKQLIVIRVGQNQYSLITNLLSSYLSGGFLSMVQYYVGRKDNPKTKDEAMRQVADFVYNVFKYHLVKYLGLFDVFFRYQISKSENISMEDVAGLGLLLQKLEYNALSPNARKVSDYGVPFKLIDCYDSKTPYDKGQFDAYEQHIDQEINRLFQ